MSEGSLRLGRHAKNKVRWIGRDAPSVTQEAVLAALVSRTPSGYDPRGNERSEIEVGGISLAAVIDAEADLVITVWRS